MGLYKRAFQILLILLPGRLALVLEYCARCRRCPRLRHPRTFTEKVLWRKIHDNRTEIRVGCNKLDGKEWARTRLDGYEVHFAETLWYGNHEDAKSAIQSGALGSGPWVLKPAALGGGLVLFGTGTKFDSHSYDAYRSEAERTRRLFTKIGGRAWGTRQSLDLIEARIGDEAGLDDYKIHVFGGRASFLTIYTGRGVELTSSTYDLRLNEHRLDDLFREGPLHVPNLQIMCSAAERLAGQTDYMRVDFYVVGSKVYFGELTPFPNFAEANRSRTLDEVLGSLWTLPSDVNGANL